MFLFVLWFFLSFWPPPVSSDDNFGDRRPKSDNQSKLNLSRNLCSRKRKLVGALIEILGKLEILGGLGLGRHIQLKLILYLIVV